MRFTGTSLLFLLFVNMLFAQVNSPSFSLALKTLLAHDVPEISVPAAITRSDAIFLDAREKNEFDVSHIKGARYVGYNQFDSTKVASIRKSNPIIVYCSVGYRSEKISERLIREGYTNVSNLYGGIFEWVNEGHPIYDQDGNLTNKIHAYNHEWGVFLSRGEKVY